MDNSYIKSYLATLLLWNCFIYLTFPLVYALPVMLVMQLIIGILCGKFISKSNYMHLLMLITIVIPINVAASFIPDPTNGLMLVYCWYSSLVYMLGLIIWASYNKIKSLTKKSTRPQKTRRLI